MQTLSFAGRDGDTPPRVLAVGAHSDDLEIGCGGTLLRLIESFPNLEVCWVVLSANGDRAVEARASAEALLTGVERRTIVLHEFRDGFLPYSGPAVKEAFESLKPLIQPDLILTHTRGDLHQDHRLVAELTWNTFRDHLILEYEIPKYDGDLGTPGFYVRLDAPTARRKVDHLLRHFPSQLGRRWFTDDLFFALLRLRGMECNAPDGYAEAFYCRKAVW